MDFIGLIRILLKRKKLLFFIPLFTALLTFILTRNMVDTYKSQAIIAAGILDDSKISLSENAADYSSFLIQSKFSNFMELIKSRTVIANLGYRLLLHDLRSTPFRKPSKIMEGLSESDKNKIAAKIESNKGDLKLFSPLDDDEHYIILLIKGMKYDEITLLKELTVEVIPGSDFIKITCESENAFLSAFIVNNLCELFIQYFKSVKLDRALDAVDFFAKLAEEKRLQLVRLTDKLKQYKMDNRIINLYEQTKALVGQISSLEIIRENDNKQIPGLVTSLIDINSRFSDKERLYLESAIQSNSLLISELKNKINSLQYSIILGNNSKQKQDSLLELKKHLVNEVEATSDKLLISPNVTKQELVQRKIQSEINLGMLRQNVISVDKELSRLKRIAEGFTPSEATISAFERDIQVTSEAYLLFLNKLNLARFSSENAGQNIQQTEIGIPSDKPEPNKKNLLVIVAGLLSFVLTVVSIIVVEYLDITIKTPKRFKLFAKMSTVGNINQLRLKALDLDSIFNKIHSDPQIEVFKNCVRDLRSLVLKRGDHKIILITSSGSKTGKSFLAIALSYVLGKTGKKILIIDANHTNPSISKMFSAEDHLAEFFSGTNGNDTLFSKTSSDRISLLGTGDNQSSVLEINTGDNINKHLTYLREKFDYIIIETPGIKIDTAAKEWVPFADKVIAVFSAHNVIEEADKSVINYFANLGDSFLGPVLNKILTEDMEQVAGELPKKRSKFRRIIKKVLRRNLEGDEHSTSEVKGL